MKTDENLTPLTELYKSHMRFGADCDWHGNYTAADWHYKQAEEIKERIANGEVYELKF